MDETTTIVLKLVMAIIIGWIIGFEREYSGKEAGTITYALVTFGATLFTIIAFLGFTEFPNADPSRIIGQIIVGIGFIGAGLIIFERHHIAGLTTAAALWATSAIGVTIGLGWYLISIISAILVFTLLFVIGRIEYNLLRKKSIWHIFRKKKPKHWKR